MRNSFRQKRFPSRFTYLFGIVYACAQLAAEPVWAQVSPPDTPAGRALAAWLDVFNNGDRAQMESYYQKNEPTVKVELETDLRSLTGGFDLLEVVSSEEFAVQFRVKERARDVVALGILELIGDEGKREVRRVLRAVSPNDEVIGFRIDAATRKRVIDGAIARLSASYVFPDTAKKMVQALRAREKRGEYDKVTNGDAFANQLTSHLQDASNDKHLRVVFAPTKFKDPLMPPSAEDTARRRKDIEGQNCGFEKAERLANNIGYIKFNEFFDADICADTAVAAMGFVANSSALIIDLRENRGGDPKMIALISTYLFAGPTHLNDIWDRKTGSTQFWTLPYIPGKRLPTEPVYVLTSQRTFSAAEEFSYNLKNLKRATLVGETTGGGAHPVRNEQVDDRFVIWVPFARAINPLTHTNWEGVGVEPDVKTSADEALTKAKQLAEQKLVSP